MNRIIDYVFYRVYLKYEKYNYPAIFSSTCYISACILCLFLPLIVPLCNMLEDETKTFAIMFFLLYMVLIFIFVLIRYYQYDKIINLRCDYSGSKLNNSIPTWSIWLILPICAVIGFGSTIFIEIHIVKPYGLTGIGYDFFVNLFGN